MAFSTRMIMPPLQWSKSLPTPRIGLPQMNMATLTSLQLRHMRSGTQYTIGPYKLPFPLPSLYILWSLYRNGLVRLPVHPKPAALLLWYNYSTGPSCHSKRRFLLYQSLPLCHPKRNPRCPHHEEHSQTAIEGRCASIIMTIRM